MAYHIAPEYLATVFAEDDEEGGENDLFYTFPRPNILSDYLAKADLNDNTIYDLKEDTVDGMSFDHCSGALSPLQFGDVSSSAADSHGDEQFEFTVDADGVITSLKGATDRGILSPYCNRSIVDAIHVSDRGKMCEALGQRDGNPFLCHFRLPSGDFAEYDVTAVPAPSDLASDFRSPPRASPPIPTTKRALSSPECQFRVPLSRIPSTCEDTPAHDSSAERPTAMTMIQNPFDFLQSLKKKIPDEEIDVDWILRFDDTSTRKRNVPSQSQKRGCVVCVARKNSSDECCGDCRPLEVEPDIVFTLDTKHHIVKFEIKASNLEFSEDGLVGQSVDHLCWKNDKTVLDTLLDSRAQCSSAQLILCIGEWTLTTQAKSKRSRQPNETVTLECSIVRSRKQSIPKSAPIDSDPREAPPPSPRWPRPSTAADYSTPAPNVEPLQSSSTAQQQMAASDDGFPRNFFPTPQSAPPLTGPPQNSFQVFHYPSSGPPPNHFAPQTMASHTSCTESPQVEINPKTGKPKRQRKPRAPRPTTRKKSAPEPSTVIPDENTIAPPSYNDLPSRQQQAMKPPWETGLPYPHTQRDMMLKSLLQSTPNTGLRMLDPPPLSRTMKSPVPSEPKATKANSALWHQTSNTPTMLPPPCVSTQTSGSSNPSMLARLLDPPTTPPSPAAADVPATPTKSKRQTNKEPRKRAAKSAKASVIDQNPRPMFQNPPQISPFLSTSQSGASGRFIPAENNCAFSAAAASTSGLFDPRQQSPPQMQMHPMFQQQQAQNPPPLGQNVMMTSTPTSSNGIHQNQWSGISSPPDYSMCHPQQQQQQSQAATSAAMMFEQHQHRHLGAPAMAGGQVQPPPALQVVPEQQQSKGGAAVAHKKRKTANGMIDRPPKQPYMNPPPIGGFQMFQQASPMYAQPNSVPSSHYSSQPSTPMPNHLSPYNCYDNQNNANGWSNGSQRPPSRSELIRMELQRTVQARKASASPNSMPPTMMSPQDMGAPRFTAPSNMSPVLLSPQSMLQPTPQSLQQQPTPPATYNLSYNDIYAYANLNDDPVLSGMFPTDQQLYNSESISNLEANVETYDFNLGNGGFDMETETTQRFVQKLLS